jgi:nicotinate-nucleotide--dimethylbenzimidazole phosphoribosyltransferase
VTIPPIPPVDAEAEAWAAAHLDRLTKPKGSLGRLEEIGRRLCGMRGRGVVRDGLARRRVVVMAADHGVVAEGVSAYPADVTPQMVANFLAGGAAINVLARAAGAEVVVVDIGVAANLAPHPRLVGRKVRRGTANLARGPAMTRDEAERAVDVGLEAARDAAGDGVEIVATGEMGIGNSTAAAAVTAAVCRLAPEAVAGRGTGVDDAGLRRKIDAIRRGLETNRPDPRDGIYAVANVGGLEIAGLAGLIVGAASRRIPVVIDGYIAGAAALVADAIAPGVRAWMIAGHRSAEPGHAAALDRLGLEPVLDLGMRLGEGTGAVLALPILDAALAVMREMATFESAGVSGPA